MSENRHENFLGTQSQNCPFLYISLIIAPHSSLSHTTLSSLASVERRSAKTLSHRSRNTSNAHRVFLVSIGPEPLLHFITHTTTDPFFSTSQEELLLRVKTRQTPTDVTVVGTVSPARSRWQTSRLITDRSSSRCCFHWRLFPRSYRVEFSLIFAELSAEVPPLPDTERTNRRARQAGRLAGRPRRYRYPGVTLA